MGGMPLERYIGKKYNYLTIVGVDRERIQSSGNKTSYVFADCDCGVKGKSFDISKIKRGETKSCGHLKTKHDFPTKNNKITLFDSYGIIYSNDSPFYFDSEDKHYLDGRYWYSDVYGYLTHCYVENGKNHYIKFHRLVMSASDGEFVDHIDRNKNNNRKTNLRICKHIENDRNKGIISTNTSGITGVRYDKSRKKWVASITNNGKTIYLGRYQDKNSAIRRRLIYEIYLFRDFSPQKHLIDKFFSEKEINKIREYIENSLEINNYYSEVI